MEKWSEIRRRVLVDGLGKRAACRQYGTHYKTLRKILNHPEPTGYRRTAPWRRSVLDPLLPVVHQILKDDVKAPRKQRHTAVRVFHRLRDEHGYQGGLTVVKDAVRAWRREHAEVFVPLAHRPGEAQVDFGEAEIILDGQPTSVTRDLENTSLIPDSLIPRERLRPHRPGPSARLISHLPRPDQGCPSQRVSGHVIPNESPPLPPIRRDYEGSRLEALQLVSAYELVVPVIRRAPNSLRDPLRAVGQGGPGSVRSAIGGSHQ
jgi:hypothetical protein